MATFRMYQETHSSGGVEPGREPRHAPWLAPDAVVPNATKTLCATTGVSNSATTPGEPHEPTPLHKPTFLKEAVDWRTFWHNSPTDPAVVRYK